MRYTTTRYQPPEVVSPTLAGQGRSRRYDIWSIGCVVMEPTARLLFGSDELTRFDDRIVGEPMKEHSSWFELSANGHATVHRAVSAAMDALERDQECRAVTALRDLLRLVRERLLVVKLGSPTWLDIEGHGLHPSRPDFPIIRPPEERAGSREFMEALEGIVKRGEADERYWFTGKNRSHIHRLQAADPGSALLSPIVPHGNRPFPVLPRQEEETVLGDINLLNTDGHPRERT
ncbi:hypothetical protein B0T19DRAFT_23112 [Cercophora scortea]|uniref:Protein kinase domain-containing protein n=1 Tax=Cercophora scortea TaxID=314031 RepID=A0AAE0J2Z0_9PEZI|nr:hypothetical protein B0T19DRAFT_23112 [Cercophora scortea]